MFVSSHEESGNLVLTYVDGDNFQSEQLAAVTDLEREIYFVSDRISQKEHPLKRLVRTEYGQDLEYGEDFDSDKVDKIQVTQKDLETIGNNPKKLEPILEEDSHDLEDVNVRLEELSDHRYHDRPANRAVSDGGHTDRALTDREIAERKDDFFY